MLCPYEDAKKEDKEACYDQLQEVIYRVPAHDMLLVTGYLNGRVGNDNTGKESNMDTHTRVWNRRGDHLSS